MCQTHDVACRRFPSKLLKLYGKTRKTNCTSWHDRRSATLHIALQLLNRPKSPMTVFMQVKKQ